MEQKKTWSSKYWYGHELSLDSLRSKRITYADLVAPFSIILANDLMKETYDIGYWELENGSEIIYYDGSGEEIDEDTYNRICGDDSDAYYEYLDVYQTYIIEPQFAEVLKEFTDELVWYNETLNLYTWGVCHWGTPWNGVNTSIELEVE